MWCKRVLFIGICFLFINVHGKNPIFSSKELIIDHPQTEGSPGVVDWDGDGLLDILLGEADSGNIWFYKNIGTKSSPIFEKKGTLNADGKEIVTEHSS